MRLQCEHFSCITPAGTSVCVVSWGPGLTAEMQRALWTATMYRESGTVEDEEWSTYVLFVLTIHSFHLFQATRPYRKCIVHRQKQTGAQKHTQKYKETTTIATHTKMLN